MEKTKSLQNKCKEHLEVCKARCCKIITFLLKAKRTPEEEADVQLILAHKGACYHKKDGVEYVEVDSECKFLKDDKCSIYDKRFDLCRRYECGLKKEEQNALHNPSINK